ncbi:MAG: aminopeptidase P family protein [Bacteroidales bacterium]|nr:aminopeptidase P family protein [Bacteroidales bacterium]
MNEKLNSLRAAMESAGIDAYIIFNTDPNNDEYIPQEFMVIRHLTGFSGDNAQVVVTKDFAGLWTDSRYFISGEIELRGSGFQMMKKRTNNDPSFITYLHDKMGKGKVVAFNGEYITQSNYEQITSKLTPKGIEVRNNVDLTQYFWPERPQPQFSDIFMLDSRYTGATATQKLRQIFSEMVTEKSDYLVLNRLDDIAWLLNLRAADIDYCPLIRSFMVLRKFGKKIVFFAHKQRISTEIVNYLTKLGVEIRDYSNIYSYLSEIKPESTINIDCSSANSLLVSQLNKCRIQNKKSPVQTAKAIKNDTELTNIQRALIMDGVAMEKFLYQLESKMQKREPVTELQLAEILRNERAKNKGFISESFECISAFNEHAAMPHYAPSKQTDLEVKRDGVYLVDSGGQYLLGTTDITRTIPTGRFSRQFATDYTLVLMGNIEIAMAVFPEGSSGSQIDILARMAMWKYGRDYGHGTGHGVGYCLNCHEGPQAISPVHNTVALKEGMIITDEPGIYIENQYGIRTENMIRVARADHKGFLKFEVMTLCHIDTRPVIKEMMTPAQIEFLNNYNQRVFNTLAPFLNTPETEYLRARTKSI